MKNKFIARIISGFLILLICSTALCSCDIFKTVSKPLQKKGFVRVNVENPRMLEKDWLDISSAWEYYQGQYINARAFYSYGVVSDKYLPEVKEVVKIPHTWENRKDVATYHMRIEGLFPNTEYATFLYDRFCTAGDVYVNGSCIYQTGVCTENYEDTVPGRKMDIAYMTSDRNGILDITLHCANKIYRCGGVYFNIRIATASFVENWFANSLILRIIFIGALFVIAIYHFALFFTNKKKFAYLYLALFSIAASIRLLFANFSIITVLFPALPYSVSLRFDLFPIYACSLCYYMYMLAYNKRKLYTPLTMGIVSVFIFFFISNFMYPVSITNYFVPFYQMYMFFCAALGVIFNFTKNSQGERNINILDLAGYMIITVSAFHDIALQRNIIVPFPDVELIMYSFVVYVIIQSINTAWIQYKMSVRINILNKEMAASNAAAYRFVPHRAIELLGKASILQIKPGDKTERTVSIMNIDIRHFTSISEGLGANRVFNMLNIYMGSIAPIIRNYGGFVEKVMGDGMFCIFTEKPEKVVTCACEINDSMALLNSYLKKENYPPIEIGIGVHSGNIVLGMLGNETRINEIIVSPIVAEVMAIQSYQKYVQKRMIFSQEFIDSLSDVIAAQFELVEQKKETPCNGYTGRLYTII